jgi:hypothetical protein
MSESESLVEGGWRPIAEAPRDGSVQVVAPGGDGYDWATAWWADDGRVGWWFDGFWMNPQPTLWHPVPAPAA